MVTNSADEKWVLHPKSNEAEAEDADEEALSLCDLPINDTNQLPATKKEDQQQPINTVDEFNFGSVFTEPEMCSADEVFFQGQILPLRHSLSSGRRSISRSESMGSTNVISNSSRSSSVRSQHSSSSGSSTTTITSGSTNYKRREEVRNQFHSHPSPTPQIRRPYGNSSHRSSKSPTWSFFRVGLVQTPGIELEDLKINRSISKKSLQNKKKGLLGGCKCSVDAVETVPFRISTGNEEICTKEDEKGGVKKEKKKTKQAMSRHRTFEWLKELSLAGVDTDHEA